MSSEGSECVRESRRGEAELAGVGRTLTVGELAVEKDVVDSDVAGEGMRPLGMNGYFGAAIRPR